MPRSIDMHVHLPTRDYMQRTMGKLGDAAFGYFGKKPEYRTTQQMFQDFDGLGVERMVVLAWDAETTTKLPPLANDDVAALAKDHPDLVIPYASVDPHKGPKAVEEAERAISRLECRGFKFHAGVQKFEANDPQFDPLWRTLEKNKVVALFHTGTTAFGGGTPGGGGVQNSYARPMPYLDDLAAKFPDLKVLAAHPGWPWHEENLALVLHKANVFMDLSGWLPKRIPDIVWKYANGPAQDKILFGSDYPFMPPDRWLESFHKDIDLKPEVREKILYKNAQRLLG